MNCEKCGEPLLSGNTFCTNCGAKISAVTSSTAVQQPVKSQSQTGVSSNGSVTNTQAGSVCSNCHTPILPGNLFCTNCGTRMDTSVKKQPVSQSFVPKNEPLTCAKCKKPVVPGNDFCLNCGARISMLPGEPTQQTNPVPQPFVQQPRYIQQPRYVPQPQAPLMANGIVQAHEAEDNQKANKLSALVLLLYFFPVVVSIIMFVLMYNVPEGAQVFSAVSSGSSLSHIAAIVLLIYTRVKYPKNKFSKILMWIWLGFIALSFVFGFLFVALILLLLMSSL